MLQVWTMTNSLTSEPGLITWGFSMKNSKVLYTSRLPNQKDLGAETLVIADLALKPLKPYSKWLKSLQKQGAFVYWVKAGEKLKALESFPAHVAKIQKLIGPTSKNLTVVSVGGGSLGDFAGFFASTYKRGVPLVQVPTTWLSIIDSAHGGKNGLNLAGVKNQIGTIYLADQIFIVGQVMQQIPSAQFHQAFGEIYKTAWLSGSALWNQFSSKKMTPAFLQKKIKSLIDHKYKVIRHDLFETKGLRYQLNFGHTVGHIFESAFGLPHGLAVLAGMQFAFAWSFERGYLKQEIDLSPWLKEQKINYSKLLKLSQKQFIQILSADKKQKSQGQISFIFAQAPGRMKIQKVSLAEIYAEYQRQKASQ